MSLSDLHVFFSCSLRNLLGVHHIQVQQRRNERVSFCLQERNATFNGTSVLCARKDDCVMPLRRCECDKVDPYCLSVYSVVGSRLLAEIEDSNPAEGMDASLLCLLLISRSGVSNGRTNHSEESEHVCVCVCVYVCVCVRARARACVRSIKLNNEAV